MTNYKINRPIYLIALGLLPRIICFLILFLTSVTDGFTQSKKSTWIWYPGDFEIWLSNQMQNKRMERNVFIPPFWKISNHNPLVNFSKVVDLKEAEEVLIKVEGNYNVTIDSKYQQKDIDKIIVPAGKHIINLQVYNHQTPPAVYLEGKTIISDKSWEVLTIRNNYPDNIPSTATPQYADSWNFDSQLAPPSKYKLKTEERKPVNSFRTANSLLVDFGQETFGYVVLKNVKGKGAIHLYYGESKEEALSIDSCETLDNFTIENTTSADLIVHHSRGFRYVNIQTEGEVKYEEVSMLYEFLPVIFRGDFKSSDKEINRIWDVASHTLHLSTREFFIDGIKRDRWIWSGDANQSYLMNYYLFFDNPSVKRTTWALRGNDPIEAHINTILDYSLYWFMSIYDYYLYTGDEEFVKQIYPKMITLMEFCLSRRNNNGMLEGLPGDWVFLDWAPITKEGELSAIQILFARSLEAMALSSSLMKDFSRAEKYSELANELRIKIDSSFWDLEQKAFVHSRKNGVLNKQVTSYANMFSMMFGYLPENKIELVKNNVLLNDKVLPITTPYMKFYELEALCAIGQQIHVTKEMKDYWGGMLNEGATSFWEEYDPTKKGAQHYSMYGRSYGKSLCHAWGASPIYLLGKYYLGVFPTKPGYLEYIVEPNLGGLAWIEGKVPTPKGEIEVFVNTRQIKVTTTSGKGILKLKSMKVPACNTATIIKKGQTNYEVVLEADKEYVISYIAVK